MESCYKTQRAQPGALWCPRGMSSGKWEGELKWKWIYVYLWLIPIVVWQKPHNTVKQLSSIKNI